MNIKSCFRIIAISTLSLIFFTSNLHAQIVFPFKSNFKYLKGIDAAGLSSDWVLPGFNDAAWPISGAPFRYGDGVGGTELTDMSGSYSTMFLRTTFTVSGLPQISEVSINVNWDDGFVLWINGKEIFGQQAPTTRDKDAVASDLHESGPVENFRFDPGVLGLVEGTNTVAVLACNRSLSGSSDFYFDMEISAVLDVPEVQDTVGLTISHLSGFYNSAFNVSVSTPVPGVNIIYTLDGSNPQFSTTAISAGTTAVINIDPLSTANRAATPGVVLRASIIKTGFRASKPVARTFLFLDKIKEQKHPGGDWPTDPINAQILDFEMDPAVVNSPLYITQMNNALQDIPTLSIVTDNSSLFDTNTGIYVNAAAQGYNWEKQCSVELINPDGSKGFNVNAGLRIRGGWSRHPNYPKHSFRLFFREEYGYSKLEFPLFESEGVDEFDKIDLRCAQNYSWSNGSGQHNTFVREIFTRDSQRDVGRPYTRSRYYHLYLNGMYWGMYQTQERAEARYASSYFGDSKDAYDVIKISGENYSRELIATDGTLDKWREVWDITQSGFSNANYFKLEGKNSEGKPMKNSEILVDIDNLIDYMINIFYTGNFDSPVTAFGSNKSPNNMYAMINREDKTSGFMFFVHDGEHSLFTVPTGPGIGLYENRANIGDISTSRRMVVNNFTGFHIQWLHYRLSMNEEYRVRFGDRANELFTGNGIFTPSKCLERFNKRAEQINYAIIAESARWGDTRITEAFTKDNAWVPELNTVRYDYFPYRTNIVKNQLLDLDLLSTVASPVITLFGDEVFDPQVLISAPTSCILKNMFGNGEFVYTLDGTDPRNVGGTVSESAYRLKSGANYSLSLPTSVVLNARIFSNGRWSALKKIDFIAEQVDYSDLKITELHYHPLDSIIGADTIPGKDYEFIEFKNIGNKSAINLTGLIIDSAIYYEFPENKLLAPKEFFVVAAKPRKFYERYGMLASGNFKKSFSNSGEQVLVTNGAGQEIINFNYYDDRPFPIAPDGEGPSLISKEIDPEGDPAEYEYWGKSSIVHGSPFANDYFYSSVDDTFADNLTGEFDIYPNPTNDLLYIKTTNSKNSFSLILYDISGALVFDSEYTGDAEISLSDLNISYGAYMLKVETNSGFSVRKLIYTP